MKLRRSPVFPGSHPADLFPRRYANVRRWLTALRRGFIAVSSQPVAVPSQPVAVLAWAIAVLSQLIALRRPLRLEVVAVFATELRLRLRCRKWPKRGMCFPSSQSQMGTKRRGRL